MSSVRFEITEDVSQGLDKLQQRVSGDMEHILRELSYEAVGRDGETSAPVPRRMSTTFNPYMYTSGQEEENKFYEISENNSSVDILYSGMELDDYLGDEARRWWEFSENFDPTSSLERDYAYYQETGRDPIALPNDARHKFAIEWGMRDAARPILKRLDSQMKRILNML